MVAGFLVAGALLAPAGMDDPGGDRDVLLEAMGVARALPSNILAFEARRTIAVALARTGDREAGRRELAEAVEEAMRVEDPQERGFIHESLVLSQAQAGFDDDARASLRLLAERAAAAEPGSEERRYFEWGRETILAELGDVDEALRLAAAVIDREVAREVEGFARIPERARRLAARREQFERIRLDRALRMGDPAQVEAEAERARERARRLGAAPGELRVLARTLAESGQIAEAEATLALLRGDDERAEALAAIARARHARGDRAGAVRDALASAEAGDRFDARRHVWRSPEPVLLLADVGATEEAVRRAEAIAADPGPEPGRKAVALAYAGLALARAGRGEEADALLARADALVGLDQPPADGWKNPIGDRGRDDRQAAIDRFRVLSIRARAGRLGGLDPVAVLRASPDGVGGARSAALLADDLAEGGDLEAADRCLDLADRDGTPPLGLGRGVARERGRRGDPRDALAWARRRPRPALVANALVGLAEGVVARRPAVPAP